MEWQWWFFNSSSNYCGRWFLDTIASPSINPYQWVDELPFPPFPHEIKVNPSYLALMQLSGTRCHLLKRKKRPETNGDENLLLSGNYLFSEEGQRQKTRIGFAIEYITLCLFVCFFLPYFILYLYLFNSGSIEYITLIYICFFHTLFYIPAASFLMRLLELYLRNSLASETSFSFILLYPCLPVCGLHHIFCPLFNSCCNWTRYFVESTISNSFIFLCYQGFYKDCYENPKWRQ